MQINLNGVDSTPRKYIIQEGHYTLKCVSVREDEVTTKNNPILKITFKDKQEQLYIEDVVVTPNTLFRIKQIAEAFGFTYENVDTNHFVGMYLVGWLVSEKVKNKHDQYVDVIKCKSFSKSAKLVNQIPAEGTMSADMSGYNPQTNNQTPDMSTNINDDEIPF
jgi:hypothetical protein